MTQFLQIIAGVIAVASLGVWTILYFKHPKWSNPALKIVFGGVFFGIAASSVLIAGGISDFTQVLMFGVLVGVCGVCFTFAGWLSHQILVVTTY